MLHTWGFEKKIYSILVQHGRSAKHSGVQTKRYARTIAVLQRSHKRY